MKSAFKKLTALLLAFVMTFSCTYALAEDLDTDVVANHLIGAVIQNIEFNYKFDVNRSDLYKNALRYILASDPSLTELALKGIYGSLDKYSTYFTADEFSAFLESVSGEFCGIGVTIMEFEKGLMVTEVHKDSPAEKAGIEVDDIIVSANGVNLAGMDFEKARSYVVGPVGSSVQIGVIRRDNLLTFDLVRSIVTTVSGYYQILEGNIGYIQLASFDEHSPEFIKDALENLKDTENIIFDLRYNPGGSLTALQEIAGLMLPKGPVMHLEYKHAIDNYSVNNDIDGFNHKLVVLVNNYTASAAEAFSAAVQDYDVGVVVGEQTTGKGTMQTVNGMMLTNGGYKLTVAQYLSPKKRVINNIGVEPDYKVAPKEVAYSDVYFEPLDYTVKPTIGATGKDVLAIEQRLNALGYGVGVPDENYDEKTFYAVKKFQESKGLYPYGVCDITTKIALYQVLQSGQIVLDKPLEKAIELASGDLAQSIKAASKERAEDEKVKK